MIRGTIIEFQARILLRMQGSDKRFHAIDTIVDTGFDGWISLPSTLIADLQLSWQSEGIGLLADGGKSRFDIYEAAVQWHGRAQRIPVYAIGAVPLIGMALLTGSELNMKVRQGGRVTIKPLASRRGGS